MYTVITHLLILVKLFISMFLDSEIDKSLEVDPDKLKDVVIF